MSYGKKINQFNNRTLLLLRGGKKYRWSGNEKGYYVLIPNRDPVAELYRLFPQLLPGEKPLNGFTCALQKDILLQGKMIICTNCICFHSNIFGYETKVVIYLRNVLNIQREKTVFIVPNAISIATLNKTYFFCSFLSRETVYKLLIQKWKDVESIDNGSLKSFSENNIIGCINMEKDRPHTSPPSFTNISERNYLNRCFGINEEILCLDNDIFYHGTMSFNSLCKSRSISDIKELSVLRKNFGVQKTAIVEEELKQLYKITVQDKIIKKSLGTPHKTLFECIRPKQLLVILVVIFIFFVSLSILVRINYISNILSLDSNNKRLKTTLSLNLKAIQHARKVFVDLKEDLSQLKQIL
ncbi:uncharacterized protein LOC105843520 isoform X8 [Hydra vulgaris]|uniref:Uncharacterized protein LOC105843520 isoform X8 n=1 Tax=Hydra vulgaris TaxID=6087 RepID=A0ABM4DEL7_HYDVU